MKNEKDLEELNNALESNFILLSEYIDELERIIPRRSRMYNYDIINFKF